MTDPSASWIEDPSLMPWRFSLDEDAGTVTVTAPTEPTAAQAATPSEPPVAHPAVSEPARPASPDGVSAAAPSATVPPWRRQTTTAMTSSSSTAAGLSPEPARREVHAAIVPRPVLVPAPGPSTDTAAAAAAADAVPADRADAGRSTPAAPPPVLPASVPVAPTLPPLPAPPPLVPPSPPPGPVGPPAPAAAQPDPGVTGNAQAPPPVGFDTYLRAQLAAAPPPRRGVRGWLYSLSGGRFNPGASARELAERDYLDRIRTPLGGWHTVTVASTKGGVGKTTTSALLGMTLAEHRADRVIAMDPNPDAGNLADRLLGHPATATVRQLLDRPDLDQLVSFTDVARFVNNAGRLQLLASDQDAAKSEAFNRDEYRRVLALLVRFFNIVITDSGTGLIHSAMTGALESTRSLIVTGAPTIDAAGHIDKTLDSLVAHGFDELVADAVIVLSYDRRARSVDPAALRSHFENRCRAVVEIPRDPHLTEGGQIDLDALRPRTRAAARELAALVADAFTWDFPTPRGFTTGPGR